MGIPWKAVQQVVDVVPGNWERVTAHFIVERLAKFQGVPRLFIDIAVNLKEGVKLYSG